MLIQFDMIDIEWRLTQGNLVRKLLSYGLAILYMVSKSSSRVTQQRRVTARECGNSRVKTLKAPGRSPLYFWVDGVQVAEAAGAQHDTLARARRWSKFCVWLQVRGTLGKSGQQNVRQIVARARVAFQNVQNTCMLRALFGDEVGKMRKRARLHETNMKK